MLKDVSLTSYEQAVKQIRSVMAARIKANSSGEIEEVHILAGPGRNPKQVVRDIEAVLAAQFGIYIDHKKISVAQFEEEDTPVEDSEFLRPKLIGVSFRTFETKAEARIELLVGEETLVALIEGPASAYNKQRLLVEATLTAIKPLILDSCVFVTEDVVVTQVGRQHAAVVTITLVTSSGEQCLVGCAIVKRDDAEAVVKATLDAVNRKLRFLHFQK